MKANNDIALKDYAVKATDRAFNIWLRDPLAIRVISRAMAAQKLDYMHKSQCNHIGFYAAVLLITDFHRLNFTNKRLMNLGY